MATLAFAAAGSLAGSALLPSGVSLLGTTLSGAAIGSRVGALGGALVDNALFGASGRTRAVEGPRLADLRVTASNEGAPIPRLYGRARLGGQIIWATDFEEVVETETTGGGKGGASSSAGAGQTTQTTYSYFANFAVALCEGAIRGIGRIWADGVEVNLGDIAYRVYNGSEDQAPDSLIAAHVGVESAPAFRGTAYVVFERLSLAPFGNRIPQLSFEVFRAVDGLSNQVRAVVLIPGTGEFSIATVPVSRDEGGERVPENVHTRIAATDLEAALDQLELVFPNVQSVSLVVSWFGTDLRAGHCEIRPGVDNRSKSTTGMSWAVAGQTRSSAREISKIDGRAAYGGTPSDAAVIQAINELKARGKSVTLTPFILMDIPPENELPDPYAPGGVQPRYPWRGRITVDPAPGVPGSADKTPTAAAQVAQLVGQAQVTDFAASGSEIDYNGPVEWSLRRFVLHCAHLAVAAGGVDAFVLGTELRGLTQIRADATSFPFVDALVQLAADVRTVVGAATKITYAADWSEYFGYHPADGSGDVLFHLDPLWASQDIDAVGIDLYWPLSDWREGNQHLDREIASSVYDLDYLKGNIEGGEYFDWYYASEADRQAQARSPITDGDAAKPWVFRAKDLRGWWSNLHFNRFAGLENSTPTAWVPMSKPVWFLEFGCPALDNASNQPNVFFDPKSSESRLPHFSSGRRDDTVQRRYIQALVEAYDPLHPGAVPGLNPTSPVYGGPMVDPARMYIYAWDARPYPAFPFDTDTWSDGANWQYGHWLNGRSASMPLDAVVSQILRDGAYEHGAEVALEGSVPGLVIDRVMSARDALQPLELAYFFDSVETRGKLAFRHRSAASIVAELGPDELVEEQVGNSLFVLKRAQETDLPQAAKLTYVGADGDYRSQVAEARRLSTFSNRVAQADLPLMLDTEQASEIAESWLFESWAAREHATFVVPPSRMNLEPGDVVRIADQNGLHSTLRIVEVADHGARAIEARSIDTSVYQPVSAVQRPVETGTGLAIGVPESAFLDLPLLRGDEPESGGYIALSQNPWPGSLAIYRSATGTGFAFQRSTAVAATMGVTMSELVRGPVGRVDYASRLVVRLTTGELASVDRQSMLAGANAAAVEVLPGNWEVLQFETAELIGPKSYELRTLLRGQAGSDADMLPTVPAGARFVLLDSRLARVDLAPADIGRPFDWRFGPTGKDVMGPRFGLVSHAFSGIGRRPLSPVHIRGRASTAGFEITWMRRTRTGGDSWEQFEVPLSEAFERYEIDILDGSNLKRTLIAATPSVTYTADQIAADFGELPKPLHCKVHQVSETWGRGAPAHAALG